MRLKEGQNDGKKIKITYNCCINEDFVISSSKTLNCHWLKVGHVTDNRNTCSLVICLSIITWGVIIGRGNMIRTMEQYIILSDTYLYNITQQIKMSYNYNRNLKKNAVHFNGFSCVCNWLSNI